MKLLLAPLQGFTDAIFRQVWHEHFRGISTFYAPYITLQNDGTIKKSQWRDLLPDRNTVLPVPQILPHSADEALALMAQIETLGVYREVNINMGCPYPMVCNKGRGSGLLPHPEIIDQMLDRLYERYADAFDFTVKLRLGLIDEQEVEAVIQVLNRYPLQALILHPRIAKQLYKGQASWSHFAEAQRMTEKPLIYNGDIDSLAVYCQLVDRFPHLEGVMLGRGVLQNPLLPQELLQGVAMEQTERLPLIKAFVVDLIEANRQSMSGESHLLSKMRSYLPYWESFNPDQRKVFKKMKKAKGMRAFEAYLLDYLNC